MPSVNALLQFVPFHERQSVEASIGTPPVVWKLEAPVQHVFHLSPSIDSYFYSTNLALVFITLSMNQVHRATAPNVYHTGKWFSIQVIDRTSTPQQYSLYYSHMPKKLHCA